MGQDQQIDQVQLLLANHDNTAFIDNGTPVNPYGNFGAFAMGVGNLTYSTQFGQVQAAKAPIDAAVNNTSRSLLGSSQETWLTDQVANGETWQIFGQQVITADVTAPNYLLGTDNITEYTSFLSQDSATLLQTLANAGTGAAQLVAVLAGAYGQPYNLDSWDGYGAAHALSCRFYDEPTTSSCSVTTPTMPKAIS